MRDVGIAQPKVGRVKRQLPSVGQALVEGPELARPSGRQGACSDHRQAIRVHRHLGRGARGFGGAVGAVIVGQHDLEPAGVILGQQRRHGPADHRCLVARRHERHHGGPDVRR